MEKTLKLSGYECQALYHHALGVPLIFLHGLSFNMDVWQRIGVSGLLVEKHVPFLAPDMPYGIKTNCHPKTRSPDKNVEFIADSVRDAFGSAVPALVGASIGGHIALRYATKYPVKGLLLVSPARSLADDLTGSYSEFKFPVRVIWGSQDNIVSGEELRTLVDKIPGAKLLVYDDARHASYLSQPSLFKRDLLEFYAVAEKP